MRPRAHALAVALAATALLAPRAPRAAPVAALGPGTDRLDLDSHAEVLRDPTCALGVAEVAGPALEDRWAPQRRAGNPGFTADCVWMRVTLRNDAPEARIWALAWSYPLMESLDLYLPFGGGWREARGGLAVPAADRGFQHRGVLHATRMWMGAGESATVLVRLRTRASMLLGLEAWSPAALERFERRTMLVLGLNLGGLLVLALLNLYSFLALRDRSHLWFCLVLASFGAYQLAETGIAAAWLWPGAHHWIMVSPSLFASLSIATGIAFARGFLGIRTLAPRLDETGVILAIAAPAAGLAGFADLRLANLAVTLIAAASFVLMAVWAAVALRAGYRAARFFLAATGIFVLSGLAFVLTILGALPPSVLAMHGLHIGLTLAGVVFTFALADRVQLLNRRTRDELEAEVAERTRTLREAVDALRREASERQRAELARRETEERFRLAFETSPDAIILHRLDDGRIDTVNEGFTAITQWPGADARGRSLAELEVLGTEDRERLLGALAQDGQARDLELRLRRRDGAVRIGLVSSNVLVVDGEPMVLSVVRDVTAPRRAEAERARLETELRGAQKMEAIGRLAGGVAHDFNNLLTVVTTNVALAILDTPAGDPRRTLLAEIDEAAQRAASLTRQLLAFGRRQILNPRPIALAGLVREMERMLSRILGEDIELALDLDPELPAVHADPAQLEQVLVNLVVNARDAMPGGGRITVSTRVQEVGAGSGAAALPPGRYAVLAVRDTGAGMDAETLGHVFEPFFTTKAEGQGTGLGLSTVYGIARQHGGTVDVESRPGGGSTFRVWLPVTRGAPLAPSPAAVPPSPLPRGTERVLLAEDEAGVREATRAMLARLGYDVHAVASGAEAIEACERLGGVAVLVTDVGMPRMNGRELAATLQARWPGLKVLYLSGYPSDALQSEEIVGRGLHFLAKPWSPEALAHKIREILDGVPPGPDVPRSPPWT
jgi:PAS domain S-box-containing protein